MQNSSTTTRPLLLRSIGSMQKSNDDITECLNCLNQFEDPFIVPCGHTFCLKCLGRRSQQRQQQSSCIICGKQFEYDLAIPNAFARKVCQLKKKTQSSTIDIEFQLDDNVEKNKVPRVQLLFKDFPNFLHDDVGKGCKSSGSNKTSNRCLKKLSESSKRSSCYVTDGGETKKRINVKTESFREKLYDESLHVKPLRNTSDRMLANCVQFDDDLIRKGILQWLTDTENSFNRYSTTREEIMPLVSSSRKIVKTRRRTRSLDALTKKPFKLTSTRSFSVADLTGSDVLVKRVGDGRRDSPKSAAKTEHRLRSSAPKETCSRKRKRKEKPNNGWNRMKQNSKLSSKVVKKPHKLDVVLGRSGTVEEAVVHDRKKPRNNVTEEPQTQNTEYSPQIENRVNDASDIHDVESATVDGNSARRLSSSGKERRKEGSSNFDFAHNHLNTLENIIKRYDEATGVRNPKIAIPNSGLDATAGYQTILEVRAILKTVEKEIHNLNDRVEKLEATIVSNDTETKQVDTTIETKQVQVQTDVDETTTTQNFAFSTSLDNFTFGTPNVLREKVPPLNENGAFPLETQKSSEFERVKRERMQRTVKKHKFVRNDLSVHFETEPSSSSARATSANDSKSVAILQDSQEPKYEEYLEKLLNDEHRSSRPRTSVKRNRSKTQQVIDECETIILETHASKKLDFPVINDRDDDDEDDDDDDEATETTAKRKNVFSESLFSAQNLTVTNANKKNLNQVIDEFNNDVDDSFDVHEDITCIDRTPDRNNKGKKNVAIVQNILIKHAADANAIVAESDDENLPDVVENTPEKEEPPVEFAEKCSPSRMRLFSPPAATTCRNVLHLDGGPFLPPPEFQDEEMIESKVDEPVPRHNPRECSVSPIPFERQRAPLHPIDAARSSKINPLTVDVSKTAASSQRISMYTSTPKQKSIVQFLESAQDSSRRRRKPRVTCTRLSNEQLALVAAASSRHLISFSSTFGEDVTHLIVAVNENNCIRDQTVKYLSAVAAGIWVLDVRWINDCLDRDRILPEEGYQVLDVSGADGPRKSRSLRKVKPLLRGYMVYAAPPFFATTRTEIEKVVTLAGGEVVESADDLAHEDGKIRLIIAEARTTLDFELFDEWLRKLKVITVDLEWLCRSVGRYECLSLMPFTSCPEDTVCDLSYYPPELLVNVACSQSTCSSTIDAP